VKLFKFQSWAPKKPHPQKAAQSSLAHSATACAPSTPGFGAGAAFYAKEIKPATLCIERISEKKMKDSKTEITLFIPLA
jgi:hypothetical protein